jgi:hypothetical protein
VAEGIGKVKVTAFDYLNAGSPASEDSLEMLVFPAGIKCSGIQLSDLGNAAVRALSSGDNGERLAGLTVLVCCHQSRDAKCGALGPPLADILARLAEEHGLFGDGFRVFISSHVGGHKWAGNVIVYGDTPADGHWFGGLGVGTAPKFMAALLGAQGDPASDPGLRPFWRGLIGKTKDEQMQHFTAAVADIEDLQKS